MYVPLLAVHDVYPIIWAIAAELFWSAVQGIPQRIYLWVFCQIWCILAFGRKLFGGFPTLVCNGRELWECYRAAWLVSSILVRK